MSKEERYTYHYDQYDYVEIIYDNEECEEIDSMKMAEKRLNRQQDKISDLEAKLADSEEQLKEELEEKNGVRRALSSCHRQNDEFADMIKKLVSEKKQLKQQLAEKEAKIETLKQRIDSIVKIYSDDFVSKDTELKELRHKVKQHNQDKISFAVEQLEKAKSFCISAEDNGWCVTHKDWLDIVEYIDNQIKAIKEME